MQEHIIIVLSGGYWTLFREEDPEKYYLFKNVDNFFYVLHCIFEYMFYIFYKQ